MEMWLTLIGIVITAIFGIIALLVEFKDKTTNKVTGWGKFAIIGIVCSAIISCGLAVYKEYKDEQAKGESAKTAREAQERYDTLLANTNRIQFPLKDVSVVAAFSVPVDDPRVKSFAEKLVIEGHRISRLPELQQRNDPWLKKNRAFIITQNHIPKYLAFHHLSPLLPRDNEAWVALDVVPWSIDIFKSDNADVSNAAPDLGFYFDVRTYTNGEEGDKHGAVQFNYEPLSFTVFTPAKKIEMFRDFSGKVAGVWDLPGSTLVVRGSTMDPFNNQSQLEWVTFTTATGQHITVLGKDFEKRQIGREYCYVHKFNASVDAFSAYYINKDSQRRATLKLSQ